MGARRRKDRLQAVCRVAEPARTGGAQLPDQGQPGNQRIAFLPEYGRACRAAAAPRLCAVGIQRRQQRLAALRRAGQAAGGDSRKRRTVLPFRLLQGGGSAGRAAPAVLQQADAVVQQIKTGLECGDRIPVHRNIRTAERLVDAHFFPVPDAVQEHVSASGSHGFLVTEQVQHKVAVCGIRDFLRAQGVDIHRQVPGALVHREGNQPQHQEDKAPCKQRLPPALPARGASPQPPGFRHLPLRGGGRRLRRIRHGHSPLPTAERGYSTPIATLL